MTTTKERIKNDIKVNVGPHLKQVVQYKVIPDLADSLSECSGELAIKLTNLARNGAAAEQELRLALDQIHRMMVKEVVVFLRELYNI